MIETKNERVNSILDIVSKTTNDSLYCWMRWSFEFVVNSTSITNIQKFKAYLIVVKTCLKSASEERTVDREDAHKKAAVHAPSFVCRQEENIDKPHYISYTKFERKKGRALNIAEQ